MKKPICRDAGIEPIIDRRSIMHLANRKERSIPFISNPAILRLVRFVWCLWSGIRKFWKQHPPAFQKSFRSPFLCLTFDSSSNPFDKIFHVFPTCVIRWSYNGFKRGTPLSIKRMFTIYMLLFKSQDAALAIPFVHKNEPQREGKTFLGS